MCTSGYFYVRPSFTTGRMLSIGGGAWGGPFGLKASAVGDAVFQFRNSHTTNGYGGTIWATDQDGNYILRLATHDGGVNIFSFYGNGTTSPSDISDERIKMNIADFDGNALNNIKFLSQGLKTFNWRNRHGSNETHLGWNTYTGFIAQTLKASSEASINRLVHTPLDGSEMKEGDSYYLDYKGITAQLVRAVTQLEARIAELETS